MSRNAVLGANSKFGENSPKFGKYSSIFAKRVHEKRVAILTKLVNLAKIHRVCYVQISWQKGCLNKLLPFQFSWVDIAHYSDGYLVLLKYCRVRYLPYYSLSEFHDVIMLTSSFHFRQHSIHWEQMQLSEWGLLHVLISHHYNIFSMSSVVNESEKQEKISSGSENLSNVGI